MSGQQQNKKVLVMGAGNFGTCLAQHLAAIGHSVTLWTRSADVVSSINKNHKNSKYLSDFTLSERLSATNELSKELFDDCDALVLAVPTQALREVLQGVKALIRSDMLIICAAKGIEMGSLKLPLGIITEVLGEGFGKRAAFLSGPSFAVEVMNRLPTAVSLASGDEGCCLKAQQLFHDDLFRVYTSNDPVGLEVAGALKNVIAIASGAVSGLGLQNNSRAAMVTRGLAEITRVGMKMGAQPLTFTGLGGVGDLFLTCTSEKSRNFSVGYRLGRGESLEAVLGSMNSVAEGVYTTKSVKHLSEKLGVQTPICDQVYAVLYENKPIQEAMQSLLTREAKAELSH